MIKDYFATRFFEFPNAFPTDVLLELLNSIKKETNNLASIVDNNTTVTNFPFRGLHADMFAGFLTNLSLILQEHHGAKFEVNKGDIWYQEYDEFGYIEPHLHIQNQINLLNQGNGFKYSAIVNLTDIGSTTFVNPNYTSLQSQKLIVKSNFSDVIMFPSNLLHFTVPHRLAGKTRSIFSFNGVLYV